MTATLSHIIQPQDFTTGRLDVVFSLADQIRAMFERPAGKERLRELLCGKQAFNVFYEPSTRTRFSFEVAERMLGMDMVTTDSAGMFSSAAKGETLADSIRTYCEYRPAVIVLRHSQEGAAAEAAAASTVSIINAGDGKGYHPTQAVLDTYTIQEELCRLGGLTVVMTGDLAHGRTARSLAYLLAKYRDNRLIFVAPPGLEIGRFDDPEDGLTAYLDRNGTRWDETDCLDDALPEADVVYTTRAQLERMAEGTAVSAEVAARFRITPARMRRMKPQGLLMHPLPRTSEIDPAVDQDLQAAYFRQAGNGVWVRAALLYMLLAAEDPLYLMSLH